MPSAAPRRLGEEEPRRGESNCLEPRLIGESKGLPGGGRDLSQPGVGGKVSNKA